MSLKGSKTERNLKEAFSGESMANRRYIYFAKKADVEGYNDVSAVFRSTAEGETGHAYGHLDYLAEVATLRYIVRCSDLDDCLVNNSFTYLQLQWQQV